MSAHKIFLKDGSTVEISPGMTSLDLAEHISPQLKKKIIVALVNGKIQDVRDKLCDGDKVILLDSSSPEAQDVICHSCEHILAAAVVDLFPGAQVTMGPKEHAQGFYYDFDIGRAFSEQDLAKISQRMTALLKSGVEFEKKWVSKKEALKIFSELKQTYKAEILDWIEGDEVTLYRSANFVDLCRGPHVSNSKFIKAFKLLGVSGSYWRGDSSKQMLQRISGVAFGSKKELDEYVFRLEEAKKRDHRKLGPQHDLFCVSEKFGSWVDPDKSQSEVQVLIYPANKSAKQNLTKIVSQAENLVANLRENYFSKKLKLQKLQVLAAQDSKENLDKNLIEFRIYASASEVNLNKICEKVEQEFNQKSSDSSLKIHCETRAHEDIGPGLVLWLPKGGRLRSIVENFSRKEHVKHGYEMVYSPHIARSDLWRISGHLGFYQDNMFAPMNIDGNEYLLKPMNCPFHVLMYKFKPKSYRDLPIRLAEFGTVYRYEMAGVLHGLMRARGFTQDDAHIFCTWEQLDDELDRVLKFVLKILSTFGFSDFEMNLSTKPQKYVGCEKDWQRAEESLTNILEKSGFKFVVDQGGGAFYGPKIDVKLKDSLGRTWQCSTIQLDFNNPERFDISYINSQGQKVRPVMLHRALFGSIERFIGILIEHYAAAFPAWLAPVQARVITVSDRQNHYGQEVADRLVQAGIRAEFLPSSDKLGAKIRDAQINKISFMLIVGDQEVQNKGATLRLRNQVDKGFFEIEKLIDVLKDLTRVVSPPLPSGYDAEKV